MASRGGISIPVGHQIRTELQRRVICPCRFLTTPKTTPNSSHWNSVAEGLPKTAVLDMLATVVAASVLYSKLRHAQDLLHTSQEILTVGGLSLVGLGKMLGFMFCCSAGKWVVGLYFLALPHPRNVHDSGFPWGMAHQQ